MTCVGIGVGIRNNGAAVAEPPSPPVNIMPPVVTGTGYVGYTLTTTNGSWTGLPAPTFTYQWQRNTGSWANIGGATASTYPVTFEDEGVPVRCVVTATNGSGSASADSNVIEQWLPSDTGDMIRWWDAANPALVALATGITLLQSRLDAATMEQTIGSLQPTYLIPGVSNKNAAEYADGSNIRRLDSALATLGRNCARMSMMVVGRTPATLTGRQLIHCYSGGAVDLTRFGVQLNDDVYQVVGRRLDTDSITEITVATGRTAATDFFASASIEHATAQVFGRWDGTEFGPVATGLGTGTTSDTASARERQGSTPGYVPTRSYKGRIAEVGIWNRALTATENDKNDGYMAWRYNLVANLPGGHPYKTVAPTP